MLRQPGGNGYQLGARGARQASWFMYFYFEGVNFSMKLGCIFLTLELRKLKLGEVN